VRPDNKTQKKQYIDVLGGSSESIRTVIRVITTDFTVSVRLTHSCTLFSTNYNKTQKLNLQLNMKLNIICNVNRVY